MPNPKHTLNERVRWLIRKNPLYRERVHEFREILEKRSGLVTQSVMFWTEAECLEFLDFAKVARHLRFPY